MVVDRQEVELEAGHGRRLGGADRRPVADAGAGSPDNDVAVSQDLLLQDLAAGGVDAKQVGKVEDAVRREVWQRQILEKVDSQGHARAGQPRLPLPHHGLVHEPAVAVGLEHRLVVEDHRDAGHRLVRPRGRLAEHPRLSGDDRLERLRSEPILIHVHPVGREAAGERGGDVTPRHCGEFLRVAGGSNRVGAGPRAGVHLAEHELATQHGRVGHALGLKNTSCTAGLVVMGRDQAADARPSEQTRDAHVARPGHEFRVGVRPRGVAIEEARVVPAEHHRLVAVVDQEATPAELFERGLARGRHLAEAGVVEIPLQQQIVAKRPIIGSGLPGVDAGDVGDRTAEAVGGNPGGVERQIGVAVGGP